MRKIFVAILLTVILLIAGAAPVFAVDKDPVIMGEAALLLDAKTGKILFEKNSTKQIPPASLTKIVTCILVLENLEMDQKVTIPAEATGFQGNNINLVEGEVLTVEQLINATMVYSANDAAVALAIEVSGSEAEFVKLMNQRVKSWGATHTNFLNSNGFTESTKHTSTAQDLAIITEEALKNKTFRELVGKESYTLPATNKSGERKLTSTNRLLFDEKSKIVVNGKERTPKYEGAFGIKTGMMLSSGYCLIGGAKRDDTEIIAIVLRDKKEIDRFTDAITLMDFGFKNYHTYEIMAPGTETGKVKVKYGSKTRVKTKVENGAYVTLPTEGLDSLADSKIVLQKDIKAPIKKGTKVGVVEIYEGEEKVDTADITITETVKKGGPWTAIYISDLTVYLVFAFIGLLILSLILLKIRKRKLMKKREAQRLRKRQQKAREIAAMREEKRRRDWPY